MDRSLHITASFDQPQLLENMVEKLAYRRYEIGYSKERMPKGWEANETSSIEAYVSGVVEFAINEESKIKMPFITCFLFTCTHGKKEPYELNWSMSLS